MTLRRVQPRPWASERQLNRPATRQDQRIRGGAIALPTPIDPKCLRESLVIVTALAALASAFEVAAAILVPVAVVVPLAAATPVGAGPLEIRFLTWILEFLAHQTRAA